ncbi:sterol regulatory element binding protein cleavage-activating protein [Mycena galericulata]|nr:sterol regulatory element binding protein cleavage-activating protein [Mycena galericulata]
MVRYGPSVLLQYARMYGNRFFLQFGLHCATHQIRIILVSCVVITSLFYPALALYSSSHPEFLSILDVTRSQYPQDLVDIWTGHDSLRVLEDAVSLARTHVSCPSDGTLRVERIFIHSPFDGAVNHQILQSTLDLERRIDALQLPCLKHADGTCFVLSPLAFWRYNPATLLDDSNILDTLSNRNVSIAGIPISPQMVLAGRGSDEPHVAGTNFDFAMFLALTYFFPNSDCLGPEEHLAWLEAVDVASQFTPRTGKFQEPTLIALEYDDESRPLDKGWTAISALLYLAYTGFFVYVSWSMRRMDAVHSRVGITFTALVEIAVSTITSVSVCALVGFKVTMVPWELLPIVIVFVGAENMFNLVDAVGKTSVTLSVKQRIAQGLSHAGTSNTLKVVSYNAILGVIAVFAAGAIRQFCVFAIVVLVAHWFLAHTFFMAVLSIDIQRLELDDLLRQNPSLAPAVPLVTGETISKKTRTPWEKLALVTQSLLRGRATKNISLLMLLAITGTLYYTTYPTETRPPIDEAMRPALTRFTTNFSSTTPQHDSPAWNIWKTLNPNEKPLYLRIEAPTVLTFHSDHHSDSTDIHRSRTSMRTLRMVFWLLKIVVLPITVTTSVLWGLLLYLLKDAELLEAQRNRPDLDSPDVPEEDESAFEGRISFSTLPRAFASDVELIATSQDGQVVVSIGTQNEVIIWRMPSRVHIAIDATDVLLRSASTSSASSRVTCVAVDADGGYCAVGTGAGTIAVWSIIEDGIHPLPLLYLGNSSASVVDLHFLSPSTRGTRRMPPLSEPSSPTEQQPVVSLMATYESGVAAKWEVGVDAVVTYFAPSGRASLVKALLLRVPQEDSVLVAFCMDDGTIELAEVRGAPPLTLLDHSICAGSPTDLVTKAHACFAEVGGSTRLVVAAATESGTVSLWDGSTGERIHLLDERLGRINHLRVSPAPYVTCRSCGKLPLDGFFLAFSVDNIVHIFRIYLTDQGRRCSCNVNPPRRVPSWDSLGRRSRSTSIAPSPGSSPSIPRAKLAAVFEPPPFPVSGHGWHSRRASEKDTGRHSLDTLTVPTLSDDHEILGPLDATRPYPTLTASVWQHAFVVCVADTPCDRGGWDVSERRVVGVRRKPRSVAKSVSVNLVPGAPQSGLTLATLERWELWSFDPSGTRVQSSTLVALVGTSETPTPAISRASTSSISVASSRSSMSSRDTIPRLPFTRVSPFQTARSHSVAGFGNTVGVFNFISP